MLGRRLSSLLALPPDASALSVLDRTGLASFAPLVAESCGGAAGREFAQKGVATSSEMCEFFSAANQLLVITLQLRRDIEEGMEKYAAHKLALLYQSINLAKMYREDLRARVEEKFEAVKDKTEAKLDLGPELSQWIISLCTYILDLVRSFPEPMLQKASPALEYLVSSQAAPVASERLSGCSSDDVYVASSPVVARQSRLSRGAHLAR